MKIKVCKICGKVFACRSNSKLYCSKECREMAARERSVIVGQPCWVCSRACGGCEWSESFKPVKGWDAIPTIVKDSKGDFSSYIIKKCPKFIRG